MTFSGKITNQNSDSLKIYNKTYSKIIKVDTNGEFTDTLQVEPGVYRLFDGGEYAQVFLKNGYDLYMTLNTEEFDESINFSGVGSENSNFLTEKSMAQEKIFDIDLDQYDTLSLKAYMEVAKQDLLKLTENKELDSMVVASHIEGTDATIKSYGNYLGGLVKLRMDFPEGTPSPQFTDYENHKGGTTSFGDLLGSYTYIDVWATAQ